jgi:hypothetical protein
MTPLGEGDPEPSQRDVLLLDHLERRRGMHETAMWQAPTLTIAAQAFLLQVLTAADVPTVTRIMVMVAGVLACGTAILALLMLRNREVEYAEAFARHSKAVLVDVDIRRHALREERVGECDCDGPLRRVLASPLLRGHWAWIVVLLAFAAADITAFVEG